MDTIKLWATEIYCFESTQVNNAVIAQHILELEQAERSRHLSNRGGWQSSGQLLTDSRYEDVRRFLLGCAATIVKTHCRPGTQVSLAGSWASVNRKGHYNASHIHHGSHWSCAYYVTATNEASIFFCDPRIRKDMDSSARFYKDNNASNHYVEGQNNRPGDAIFFPGWLEHGVRENPTDMPRISISCDFVLSQAN